MFFRAKSAAAVCLWSAAVVANIALPIRTTGSQLVEPPRYNVRSWQTDEGLPQNSVWALAQTPDGYLWVGTHEGLARFDGVRFTIFDKGNTKGILNNRFIGVFVDKEGTIWKHQSH